MDSNLDKNQEELNEQGKQADLPVQDQKFSEYYSNSDNPLNFQPAPKSHKAAGLFIVVSLFIVAFTGYQIYRNIVGPVEFNPPEWLINQLNQDAEDNSIEALKDKDTDSDGLTDYQELYQFKTSIFLEDSDSDGATDFEEVNKGDDPMCPIGQSCNLLRLITPETKLSDIIQDVSLDPNLTVEQAAVAEFRKFLLENGLPQEELDILTDADLIAIFQIWQESNVVPADSWSATTTADEVRAFLLIQPEADVEEIKSLSEEELFQIRDKLMSDK
jgi:hypothetical protein